VLVCIDYRSRVLPHFRSNSFYGINVLRDDQRDLSVRFSQRRPDEFEGVEWRLTRSGVPILQNCLASFECCVTQTVEAGDHALFIGEVVSAEYRDGHPLIYFGSGYRHLSEGK
jgi:flavin reductase (DIM6/NTAB) family NADH-FMN oxidoreductase RutF